VAVATINETTPASGRLWGVAPKASPTAARRLFEKARPIAGTIVEAHLREGADELRSALRIQLAGIVTLSEWRPFSHAAEKG
jgi:hypothetical protein